MSCELNGGQERAILRWAERRAEWDLRGGSGGRCRACACVRVCVRVCVSVCVSVAVRVCVSGCVRAAPGPPFTSSLFRSIREQIPVRGGRRRPRHTGRSRGGLAAPRPGPSIGCSGLSGQPRQPIGAADIALILISLMSLISLISLIIITPPTPRRALSCGGGGDGRRRCALRRPEIPLGPRGPGRGAGGAVGVSSDRSPLVKAL